MLRRVQQAAARHARARSSLNAPGISGTLAVHGKEPLKKATTPAKLALVVVTLGGLHLATAEPKVMLPPPEETSRWSDAHPSPTEAKPRILIVSDNLPSNVNGVVTFLRNMEAHARDAYDVVYMTPEQFPHVDCPGYPDIKLAVPFGFADKLAAAAPDFVHLATEGPLGLVARLYCDAHGIAYNSAYHTRIPEYMQVTFGVPLAVGYSYLRWFHANSRQMLTTTDTMVAELRRRGFRPPIQPMKFGVDRTVFRSDLRRRDRPSTGGPVLLSVGRVSKEKGLDAFCELNYPGATKIVVGDGAYRRELEARYPEIQFVGVQTRVALAELYANADCLVFTSRTDTFGLVMIESLACGTPVAAFPVPGPIDAIENGVTGYLSEDLKASVEACLALDRRRVDEASHCWSWEHCWATFQLHLIPSAA
ncbi:glycosyltransferase [Achlya hypogyna]|uniref:Glycosyltransferase n=1 Tax=Achlya hypogyna TaxID=1202772 RepID=A0A1V9ZIM1_ACHHY|nr:glycosyltransferase [Achlya hypogyna]